MSETSTLEVTLECESTLEHYQQIYTGFALLAHQGRVRLRMCRGRSGLAAVVDGRRLFFDVQDATGIDAAQLAESDFYYKRSYRPGVVNALPDGHKVQPLGLNYHVLPDFRDVRGLWRALCLRGPMRVRLSHGLQALNVGRGFRPSIDRMQAAPAPQQPPKVLFLTRAWEPEVGRPQQPTRDALNATRAACIRAVRSAFGASALAGFADSPYARANYPDLVMVSALTSKVGYLSALRNYPICVSTTGLHGSVGWKMGEYVAFAKAIVSEPLLNRAPAFEEGEHYLAFRDAAECVARISELFDDPQLRRFLMYNNAEYYQRMLRPDRLVWRALTRPLDAPLGAMNGAVNGGVAA